MALAVVPAAHGACTPKASPGYTASALRALRSGEDVWGDRLLHAPGGPTFARADRYLKPLLYARTSKDRPLTASGVYYLPFAMPKHPSGAGSVMLHVADGSRIYDQKAGGRSLAIRVGGEPYGSCLARLTPARLADGWLPILETAYRGAGGARFAQESFSTGRRSFVRLRVATGAHATRVRFNGRGFRVPAHTSRTIRIAWPRLRTIDERAYAAKRRSVVDYWRERLAKGASFVVPEARVMNAERALLVQNLELAYRYSIGNPYEEFSFPESLDSAQVAVEYGFAPVSRSIIRTSLTRRPTPYPSWKQGEKLLAAARYWRLTRDATTLAQLTPVLRGYVADLRRRLTPRGILRRERYSSDIPDQVYGLHGQAVVWEALRELAGAWAATGRPGDARRARSLAARLGPALRRAVRASQRRLPDGSLFVPVRLLDGQRPYGELTASRRGSYWNLVMPYALASRLFPPGGAEARGILRYVLRHGSRLLGMVRSSAFALYGQGAPDFPVSGTDQVYGLNMSRFLADEDEPDQLVLSLYGQLAAGMTPHTFVAGEAASVAPLHGLAYRAMYLPPNAVANGSFLETLRLMLVHETPDELQLAYSTPRAWLAPGKRIEVRDAPTRFGPLSYSLEAGASSVRVTIEVPPRARRLSLRLRLPGGTRTVDLTGRRGTVHLRLRVENDRRSS